VSAPEFARVLVRSADYRSFLKVYFAAPTSGGVARTYSKLARKAGFSARSYPRAVVTGQRRLGPKALARFAAALELPTSLRRYFTLLVYLEEPDTNFEGLPVERISRELTSIRRETERKSHDARETYFAPEEQLQIFDIPGGPEILASLGSPEKGATIPEVCRRTGLSEPAVRQGLFLLQRAGLGKRIEGTSRYTAIALHLVVKPRAREKFFREFYLRALQELPARAVRDFEREECLFFNSVYLVRESALPRLKKELRELLLRYVDGAEESEGDRLVRLIAALTI
jgi:uncharacterized protein (TIGR02147 family)